MAFKMRSGNKTVFKKMGSSPAKEETPIPNPETLIDEVTIHGKKKEKPKLRVKPTKPTEEGKPIKVKPIKVEKQKTTETRKKYSVLSQALKRIKEEKEERKRKEARRKLEAKREKSKKKAQAIINILDKPGLGDIAV